MLVDTIDISTIHLCVNVETGDSGDPDLDVSSVGQIQILPRCSLITKTKELVLTA